MIKIPVAYSPSSQQSDTFHLSESFENHLEMIKSLKLSQNQSKEFARDLTNENKEI